MRKRQSLKPPPGSLLASAVASTSIPITMNLGGVNVKFDKIWKIEHTEFDKAAIEVEKVMNERDALLVNLHESLSQIKALRNEVTELNNTNKAALDLLLEEKQKTYLLTQQLEAYQAELEHDCRIIAELQLKMQHS